MPRIHVIGSAGAGKTVLAFRLAEAFNVDHIELDNLFWGDHWQPAETEEFQRTVREALTAENWVADGNYSKVRPIVWERAQIVVWLDYPLMLVLLRLFKRSLRRVFGKELLWGRNRESFQAQFLSRDSLFLYVLRTHQTRRTLYEQLSRLPETAGIKFIRLRSPRQTEQWAREFIS